MISQEILAGAGKRFQMHSGRAKIILIILFFFMVVLFPGVDAQDTLVFCHFDTGLPSGWTTGATGLSGGSNGRNSWSVGVPKGGRGYSDYPGQRGFIGNPDPLVDHTLYNSANRVAGQGIRKESRNEGVSSHYNRSNEWLQTSAINCSNYINTRLAFWRWANFEKDCDKAIVEISTDGIKWIDIGHTPYPQDTEWTMASFDISAYADHASSLYVRWRSESDTYIHYSGWNIDDVLITGEYNNHNATSKILAGPTPEPLAVSSTVDTEAERLAVFDFMLQDMGSGDNLPTIIDTLVITQGSSNQIADWNNALVAAYLFGPDLGQISGTEFRGTVLENSIIFGRDRLIEIADNTAETYVLKIFLRRDLSQVSDNSRLEFRLSNTNIIENKQGSFFGSGNTESGDSQLKIDIKANRLVFETEPPALVTVNTVITPSPVVKALDENGNQDLDLNAAVTLSNSASLGMTNYSVTATSGVAIFTTLQFTQSGGPASITATCADRSILSAYSTVRVMVTGPGQNVIFSENFDQATVSGWTSGALSGSNSWVMGQPRGGQGYSDYPGRKGFVGNNDPLQDHSSDNSINQVYGQGLSYTSKFEGVSSHFNKSNEWLQSPAINCQSFTQVKLRFWRWANFENNYDKAFVEISTDGISWTDLGQPLYPQDRAWTMVEIDIAKYADRKSNVYIRWRSLSGQYVHYAGWNIDDVSLTGQYAPVSIWNGSASADWNNAVNWDNGKVPDMYTSAIIPGTATLNPVISGNAACRELTIGIARALTIQNTGNLTIYGDLTLETNATSYGSMVDQGNLTLNGRLNISRQITGRGWHYLSSPVAGYKTYMINNTVYRYNEPLASSDWLKGWQRISADMESGRGYNVYFAGADTVNYSGAIQTGAMQVSLTHTDGAETPEHEGWNLVGNPYPSAIDWDASAGWSKDNIENAIYIWDETQGNYRTYVNGIGTNGGTRYIAPMQGFFVRVASPGQANLGFSNAIRVIAAGSRFKKTTPNPGYLKLTVTAGEYRDETVVAWNDTATDGFDAAFDAYKKFTSNPSVPQLFSLTNDSDQLAINVLSTVTGYHQIPICLFASASGEYQLTAEGAIESSNGKTIYLEDRITGKFIDLIEKGQYQFSGSETDSSGRFVLHVGMPLSLSYTKKDNRCHGASEGEIDITVMGGRIPYQNILWSNESDIEDLTELAAGQYQVVILDAEGTVVSETISIDEPGATQLSLKVQDASSAESSDGSIDLSITGAAEPNTFEWSNQAITEDLYDLSPGVYTVTITDAMQCETTATATVQPYNATGLNPGVSDGSINIYGNRRSVYIRFSDGSARKSHAAIYSISGNLVLYQPLTSDFTRIDTQLPPGHYVVKVIRDNISVMEKIMLH
jgi:hypothetical protein